jgi:hypothetical protein
MLPKAQKQKKVNILSNVLGAEFIIDLPFIVLKKNT